MFFWKTSLLSYFYQEMVKSQKKIVNGNFFFETNFSVTQIKINIFDFGPARVIILMFFLLFWKFFVHEFRYKTAQLKIDIFNFGPVRDINLSDSFL